MRAWDAGAERRRGMIAHDAFRSLVERAAQQHRIPGLSAAVMHGDDIRSTTAGVLNLVTGAPAGETSVFQIGSITKIFTATLVMQFVDAGRVELDAPIRRYLPGLQIAGRPIDTAITVRMLLAHTSGIAGDCFVDTGRNDDATRRYVEYCSQLTYLHAPGRFSYCNSGYVVLGRLIEVLAGRSWVAQLRAALLEPLRMPALSDAEEALLYSAAAGHVIDAAGRTVLTPTPFLPRSTEAAGARLSMSARTLLTFARCHLRDGLADDGMRVLSAHGARAMRELQTPLPFPLHGNTGYGLGWALRDGGGPAGFGHNGATVGQSAFLIVLPALDVALAVLTNSSSGAAEAFDVIARAVVASLGAEWPLPPQPDRTLSAPVGALAGRYETAMSTIDIRAAGDELRATVTPKDDPSFAALPPREFVLAAVTPESFIAVDAIDAGRSLTGFTDFTAGIPNFVFWGGRLAQRMDAT